MLKLGLIAGGGALPAEVADHCRRAGLAGIVGEAGRLLVVDREEVVALADELGLFIHGVEP